MKRNILLLIALVVIGLVVFYVYKNKGDRTTTIDRAESNFKIEDVNTIGRIILTHKDGTRSDLKRVGDYWVVNDMHRVRQSNINHLLKGIQTQHLDHIPNKAATENILPSMAVTGIHVEIFDLKGEGLLNYYVGGVTQDERGTFFLKEGATQPYCLNQPGFDGGLRARYALAPVDWRDVHFWMEDTEKMDTMKVYYPKQIQHSFVIYKKGIGYGVEPMFSTTPRKEGDVTNRVKSYFTNLASIACEERISVQKAKLNAKAYDCIVVYEYEVFDHIQFSGKFSLIDLYLDLARTHKIAGFLHEGDRWVDVGKPESVAIAEAMFE